MENEVIYIIGISAGAVALSAYAACRVVRHLSEIGIRNMRNLEKIFDESSSEERNRIIKAGKIAKQSPGAFDLIKNIYSHQP